MFEVSTGSRPFQGGNLNDLLRSIVGDELAKMPAIYSDSLRQVVRSMLQKDPKLRPSADEILELAQVRKALKQLKIDSAASENEDLQPDSLKTRKYEEGLRINFDTDLKTVKHEQKERHSEPMGLLSRKVSVESQQTKDKVGQNKKVEFEKFKDRSLRSLIDRKKS